MKNAIALGTFDGLHRGHRAVLTLPGEMKKTALIFSLPPKAVLGSEPLALMLPEDKERALYKLGMDEVCALDFEKVRRLSAKEFFEYLVREFSPDYISCGFNYRFGRGAEGNSELLRELCENNGIAFNCLPPVECGNGVVSSTEIRALVREGSIEAANSLLYEPFSYTAEVLDGDRRGRTIGFPTANQRFPDCLVRPRFGVYAVKAEIDGKCYDGITDLGVRPTFKSDFVISETHIRGYSGDIYGKALKISLRRFIRPEKKFSSLEALKEQIKADLGTI